MAPNIQDRLNHAKEVTKWKVDQQSRILKAQNKISDLEKQVSKQKVLLGEEAFDQYLAKKIKNEDLKAICEDIASLLSEVDMIRAELEAARSEEPPEIVESVQLSSAGVGLVCPECGKSLTGKFCPDHGLEGVAPEIEEESVAQDLVCPDCGKPVAVKFCNDCGKEGVPASE